MRVIVYLLVVGIAAVVSFLLSLLVYRLSLRFRLYPKIRERDVHTRPTPRLGGIGMLLGVLAAFAVGSQLPAFALVYSEPGRIAALLGAAVLIVLLGVADDIWDLDWLTKLAGQFIAAGLLAWQGFVISQIPIARETVALFSPVMSLVITVLVIVLVMNAINFIDGLDGLVVGVALIANGVFFVYTYVVSYGPENSDYYNLASFITAALIGACIGFLPLNWHPARMFMGDSGALLVGLLMATSAIAVTGQIDPERITGGVAPGQEQLLLGASGLVPAFLPIVLPFAVLVIPLLDFSLAVIRRLAAGKSPFSADRKHLHHRLLDMGHSHFHAVLIFYGWTAAASIGCLLFLFVEWWWALAFTLVALAVCTVITLLPRRRKDPVPS